MELLAIRTELGKGVYKYETNGEKSRILSKYPGSSTRCFPIEQESIACEWAGVESLVSEEINFWAKTKEIKEKEIIYNEKKESKIETKKETNIIKEPQEKQIEEIKKEKEEIEQTIKHIQTDFEKILDVYKKNGQCYLEITMIDGETYYIIVDSYWYLSKDARKYKLNNNTIDSKTLTCEKLRELIYEELKIFKETKTGPKNPVFGEVISPEMFAMIPKTKYFAYGDLVYIHDANYYTYEENIDESGTMSLIAKKENKETKKNVTINTKNISKINTVFNDTQKIETKEFINLLKKVQKEKRAIQ